MVVKQRGIYHASRGGYIMQAEGDISCIASKLMIIELKLLRRIIGVKSGTFSDLVYYESKRSNVISKSKDKQYKFFQKLKKFSVDDTVAVGIMKLYECSSIIDYYKKLHGDESFNFMNALRERVDNSENDRLL